MKPRVIKSASDHQSALSHIESLMEAVEGSAEESELELWALLVDQYEEEQFPIDAPDPVEAIKFRMDQLGLEQKDLSILSISKSKISEVLNRKRPLSLPMIRAFHAKLGIPAEVLIKETKIVGVAEVVSSHGKTPMKRLSREGKKSKVAKRKS